MKIIKKLSELIDEELDDAEKYVKCALNHKDTDRGLADVFYTLSVEEMRHVNMLHAEIVKKIEQHRREHGDPPVNMQAIYDYLHEKQIDKAADIKTEQAMFKDT